MAKGFGTIVRLVPAVGFQDIVLLVGLFGVRTATGSARQDSPRQERARRVGEGELARSGRAGVRWGWG